MIQNVAIDITLSFIATNIDLKANEVQIKIKLETNKTYHELNIENSYIKYK